MPPRTRILIVPDLQILICDKDRYQHDIEHLQQFLQTLIEHIDAYETYREKYSDLQLCLSVDLKQELLEEFPWDQNEKEPLATELIDIFTAVLPWLTSAVDRDVIDEGTIITVRDAADNCYFARQETCHAWRRLINSSGNCWQGPNSTEYIKVISALTEVRRVQRGDRVIYLVEVFPPPEWSDMMMWAVNALPRVGEYPYKPHRSWNRHLPFPRKGSGANAGPRDDQDNSWTWDYLHGGTHWHIVAGNEQRLYEVTPDGRIHHEY